MFWIELFGLVIGVILVAMGLLSHSAGKPDHQLAELHRADAVYHLARGEAEMASRALRYAEEAENGDHLAPLPRAGGFMIVGGVILGAMCGLALLLPHIAL